MPPDPRPHDPTAGISKPEVGAHGSRRVQTQMRQKAKAALPPAPPPTPHPSPHTWMESPGLSGPVQSSQNGYRDRAKQGTPTPRIPALGSPHVCPVDM